MTSSRIVRGTKIRIFVCFCAVVVILGILACYNNTISQLDETQRAVKICHQQQENLAQQLQVISDVKLHLETAIKEEKTSHMKSNTTYSQAMKDEKSRNDKKNMDATLRYDSMKQRYNLLQTEYDDYKTKQTKTHQEQVDEINNLRTKLKEAQNKNEKIENSKEKLKTEYMNIQVENDNLKKQVEEHAFNSIGTENKTNYLNKQNIELKREVERLKDNCPEHRDKIEEPVILKEPKIIEEDTVMARDVPVDQNVLAPPVANNALPAVKSSSTLSSAKQSSQGSLNGARPLALPTMTPENIKKSNEDVLANPNANKAPDGVLPLPDNVPEGVVRMDTNLNENQISNDIIDNRYQIKMDEVKPKKPEEMEKENVGNEVFEQPNVGDDELGFGDSVKNAEKHNLNKQHINNLAVYKEGAMRNEGVLGGDYKERPNDQLEENAGLDEAEDDDQDEYGDHLGRHKEPAVRN